MTKVPLTKQKVAKGLGNSSQREAPGKKKLATVKSTTKKNQTLGQQKVGKKVQRKVRKKANVNIADNTNWTSDLYDPLHLQNPHRHDEIDIVVIEKDYHSGGKYIRQL